MAVGAAAALEIEHGPESWEVVQALILVGWIRQELQEHKEAERVLRRAVDIAEGLSGPPELALLRVRALESLAASLRIQGRYHEAETVFRRALAEAEEEFGPSSGPVADVLGGLGVTFKYAGRFDEAESLFRRAIAIVESGDADPSALATLYHNFGGLEHARGNYEAAEPLARRSVELREQAFGPAHPDAAADRAALAAIVDALGRHDEAERCSAAPSMCFEASTATSTTRSPST